VIFRRFSLFLGREQRSGYQALLSGAQSQYQRQWAEIKTRETSSECKENFFYHEDDQMVEQVAQRSFAVSVFGATQNLSEHSPGQPSLGVPA